MQLKPSTPAFNLLPQWIGHRAVAFAHKAEIHRQGFSGFQHPVDVPRAGGAGGGIRAGRGARAAAEHGRDAGGERFVDLLRADEVDVRVDAARRDDHAFAGDHFGAAPTIMPDRRRPWMSGLPALPMPTMRPSLDADVGFDDAPVIDDQRIGDDQIERRPLASRWRLAHAVADHLAAAELHLVAVGA